jgi:hypothetical protein
VKPRACDSGALAGQGFEAPPSQNKASEILIPLRTLPTPRFSVYAFIPEREEAFRSMSSRLYQFAERNDSPN